MTAEKSWAEAVREAVGLLLEKENGVKRGRYATAVFLSFGEIERLREMRISLAEICRVFESTGLLPENAKPGSLREAYRREKARRLKKEGGAICKAAKMPEGVYIPVRANAKNPEPVKTAVSDEGERLKELTGTLVDTGLGVIRKLPNGSFEY